MSQKYLTDVMYLEASDVGSDGSVLNNLNNNKKGVVMLQGLFCGHCTKAKPAFQSLANAGKYYAATIQIDGGVTEKEANKKLSAAFGGDFKGVPHYYLIDGSGKFVKHYNGARTKEGIEDALNAM